MKIGFIFECGPQGADKQVCEYFATQLRPGVTLISQTLDNKLRLLAEAAEVAKVLLADGCERVLIVWDLIPAWPDKRGKPCRAEERQTLLNALANEGLQNAPVHLVCVEQELESWVLADEAKLGAYLSSDAHSYKVPRVRKPDRVAMPKAAVMKHFTNARGWRYEDRIHAIKVVGNGALNLSRLRRSDSFARFEAKLK
jgi:hypothetical protein